MNSIYCLAILFIASIAGFETDDYHHHHGDHGDHHHPHHFPHGNETDDLGKDACKDNPWWKCEIAQNYTSCDGEKMSRNCPVTCGSCDSCGDMLGEYVCARKTQSSYFCNSRYSYMCRKSCDKCGGNEEAELVDGGWSEWSNFGRCSSSCGGGTTKRSRRCTNPSPQGGGKECEGDSVESEVCGSEPCPTCQDNKWWRCEIAQHYASCDKDSMKRNCPVTCDSCDYCADMLGEYICKKAMEKFDFCGYGNGKLAFKCRKSCGICVVSGWTEWGDWGECSDSCGGGTKLRHRTCRGEEKDCEGESSELAICGTDPCPTCQDNPKMNCAQQNASCDSEEMRLMCPTTCNSCDYCGDQMGEALCQKIMGKADFCGYKRGAFAFKCRKSCGLCVDSVDGGWSEWSDWDECSDSCAGGTKLRHRSCTNPAPQGAGKDCDGESSELAICNADPCPTCNDNPKWNCAQQNASCDSEEMRLNCPITCDSCDYCGDQLGEALCQKIMGKADFCGYKRGAYAFQCRKSCGICEASGPDAIDGGWTEWSDWDECSASCGGGNTERHRTCTNPEPQNGGKNCEGEAIESDVCGTDPCPIDGGWGKWLPWSTCSKTCGSGEVSRSRACDSPAPENGGNDCDGEGSQTVPCYVMPCDDEYTKNAKKN